MASADGQHGLAGFRAIRGAALKGATINTLLYGAFALLLSVNACRDASTGGEFVDARVTLVGQVLSGAQRQPVPGVRVVAEATYRSDCTGGRAASNSLPDPITGADGGYATEIAILVAPTGEYCVRVTAQGVTAERPRVMFRGRREGPAPVVRIDVEQP